ncbi:hypothetical protein BJF82_02840 [Kytococcus sp. CUA-901]|nr:hypothetical protein BJF82_02840 [Kytococcus sp. CUA-901]
MVTSGPRTVKNQSPRSLARWESTGRLASRAATTPSGPSARTQDHTKPIVKITSSRAERKSTFEARRSASSPWARSMAIEKDETAAAWLNANTSTGIISHTLISSDPSPGHSVAPSKDQSGTSIAVAIASITISG